MATWQCFIGDLLLGDVVVGDGDVGVVGDDVDVDDDVVDVDDSDVVLDGDGDDDQDVYFFPLS